MVARNSVLAPLAALALGLAACGDTRPIQQSGAGQGLCVSCHGGTDNVTGAPPVDLSRNTATTAVGVGAHTAHVSAGPLAGAFGCAECHEPVTSFNSPGHRNGVVDLPFGALSKTGGVVPAWNPGAAGGPSCSTVYCHGSFPGGNAAAPVWTKVGQGEAACGTCHGTPPGSPHPAIGTQGCNACHARTAKADGTIDVAGGFHVNGAVDVLAHTDPSWLTASGGTHVAAALGQAPPFGSCLQCHVSFGPAFGIANSSCNACHASALAGAAVTTWQQNCVFCHGDKSKLLTYTAGDQTSDPWIIAPPTGAQGETLTTDLAVGVHQQHVNPASNPLSSAFLCSECHTATLPPDLSQPGHLSADGSVPVLLAGPVATSGGVQGTFTAPSCSATYCHGNFANGGNNATPSWIGDSSASACTACHGVANDPTGFIEPKTGRHPNNWSPHAFLGNQCQYCHSGIATATSATAMPTIVTAGKAKHVNGTRDVVFSGGGTWTPNATTYGGTCAPSCHGSQTW